MLTFVPWRRPFCSKYRYHCFCHLYRILKNPTFVHFTDAIKELAAGINTPLNATVHTYHVPCDIFFFFLVVRSQTPAVCSAEHCPWDEVRCVVFTYLLYHHLSGHISDFSMPVLSKTLCSDDGRVENAFKLVRFAIRTLNCSGTLFLTDGAVVDLTTNSHLMIYEGE